MVSKYIYPSPSELNIVNLIMFNCILQTVAHTDELQKALEGNKKKVSQLVQSNQAKDARIEDLMKLNEQHKKIIADERAKVGALTKKNVCNSALYNVMGLSTSRTITKQLGLFGQTKPSSLRQC